MKRFLVAAAMTLTALPALASDDDIIKVRSTSDVATTMDRLEAAVTGAGATVFARVDHAAGAASVDLALDPSQVLIFGNPKMGTAAMQDDPLAGETWLAYQDPEDMFDDTAINDDADYIKRMTGALGKLTGVAAGQ